MEHATSGHSPPESHIASPGGCHMQVPCIWAMWFAGWGIYDTYRICLMEIYCTPLVVMLRDTDNGVGCGTRHTSPQPEEATNPPEESAHRAGHIACRTGCTSQTVRHCIHAALTNRVFASPGTRRQQKNLLQARSALHRLVLGNDGLPNLSVEDPGEPRVEEPRLRLDQRRADRRRRIRVDQDAR